MMCCCFAPQLRDAHAHRSYYKKVNENCELQCEPVLILSSLYKYICLDLLIELLQPKTWTVVA